MEKNACGTYYISLIFYIDYTYHNAVSIELEIFLNKLIAFYDNEKIYLFLMNYL
jgi:hypothetical protein